MKKRFISSFVEAKFLIARCLTLLILALLSTNLAWGTETTLTFDVSKNPGSWPTGNSTTLTNYTYKLNNVDYTFGLMNVKCNSGYLMLTSTAVLGLPAIDGYKLTKVVAKNSSSCSTTTKVGVSSSSSSASYISGGAIQTWSTTSSSYTYNLSGTSNNTMYYLYVTNKNAQITELALTYEGDDTPSKTLESIAISGTPKTTYEIGESFDPAGLTVTGKYNDASTDDLTDEAEWTIDPATFISTSQTSVSVTATVDGKSDTKNYAVTVTEHTVTPGTYEISLNNALYGISTGNNGTEQSVKSHDITIVSGCSSSASSKTYYDTGHIRYYADSYLKLSVPNGYLITSVVFTANGDWKGSITADPDTYIADTKTWSGKSQNVNFAFGAQNRAAKITVTFIANVPAVPHTVTFDAGTNGTCETPSLTESAAEAGVTLPTCIAKEGYEFVGWSSLTAATVADAGKAGDTYKPVKDCTLYAVYAKLYAVTIETPENGTLVVKNGDNVVTSGTNLISGTVLTIEANPAEGYKFKNWQAVDATTRTYEKSFSYTMGESDVTIKAKFEEKSKYTIDYMVNGVSKGKQVDLYEDEYMVFPEVSNVGEYIFAGWKKGSGIAGTVESFTDFAEITENMYPTESTTYYAVFHKMTERSVTFDPNNVSSSGTLTWTIDNVELKLSAGQLYTSGSPKTFTVTNGTNNYFQVKCNTESEYIKSLVATITSGTYKINSVSSGATLSTSSTTQTVTVSTTPMNSVKCYATSGNQIRVTKLVANVYHSYGYCTMLPVSVNMTITSAKWGTFCAPFDVTVPDGVKAYIATEEDGVVTFDDALVDGVLMAGVPVVVYSEGVVDETFTETPEGGEATCTEGALVGVYAATSGITAAANHTNYVLQNNAQGVGFYKVAEGSTISLKANRCYMTLPTSSAAKDGFSFEEIITGINEILNPTKKSAEGIFDLNGRKLAAPQKGINIINGVKVIVK